MKIFNGRGKSTNMLHHTHKYYAVVSVFTVYCSPLTINTKYTFSFQWQRTFRGWYTRKLFQFLKLFLAQGGEGTHTPLAFKTLWNGANGGGVTKSRCIFDEQRKISRNWTWTRWLRMAHCRNSHYNGKPCI